MDPYQQYLANWQTYQAQRRWLKLNRPRRAVQAIIPGQNAPGWVPASALWAGRSLRRSRGYGRGGGRYYRRRYRPRFRRYYRGRGGFFADALGSVAGWFGDAVKKPASWLGVDTSGWKKSVTDWGEGAEESLFGKYMGRPYVRAEGPMRPLASGLGAYNKEVVGPNERLTAGIPQMANLPGEEGAVVIKYREYLGDLNTPTSANSFNVAYAMALNPGLEGTFPWLSGVAKNFCQYRFISCIFTFKSTSGALSTTQALGKVLGSANYNVYDSTPANPQQMLAEVLSFSSVPSEDQCLGIECDPKQTPSRGLLKIRGGTLSSTQGDLTMYDMANIYFATSGVYTDGANRVCLGEIWVSYEVILYKPQLDTIAASVGGAGDYAHYAFSSGVSASSPTATLKVNADTIGLTFTSTTMTFPAAAQGVYSVYWEWTGTAATITYPVITVSSGISTSSSAFNGSYLLTAPSGNTANVTKCSMLGIFTIANTGTQSGIAQEITLGTAGTLPSSITDCHVVVTKIPSSA